MIDPNDFKSLQTHYARAISQKTYDHIDWSQLEEFGSIQRLREYVEHIQLQCRLIIGVEHQERYPLLAIYGWPSKTRDEFSNLNQLLAAADRINALENSEAYFQEHGTTAEVIRQSIRTVDNVIVNGAAQIFVNDVQYYPFDTTVVRTSMQFAHEFQDPYVRDTFISMLAKEFSNIGIPPYEREMFGQRPEKIIGLWDYIDTVLRTQFFPVLSKTLNSAEPPAP